LLDELGLLAAGFDYNRSDAVQLLCDRCGSIGANIEAHLVTMLNRKLARELYRSQGLLLAITSIIAVGDTCYVTMQSAYHNLSAAKQRYYRQCRMADFWIDVKKVPLAELDAVARLPGVTEIQPRIQFSATVDLENEPRPINGLVLSLPQRRGAVINDVVLRQGGYFTGRRQNEVIINDAFARAHNLYPGQSIHLLLNNRRQELLIVGTAISSEFTYLLGPGAIVPDPEHFGVFYITQRFAEEVFDFQGAANQIVGRMAPDARDSIDDVLRRAETLLDSYGVFNTTPLKLQGSNQFLSNEIAGLRAFATVMPTIFLAVAAVVLNVLIMRLARQQRTVVGTLKALGYTDWQVFAHFVKFGLSVGVLGGLLGSFFGYLLSAGMTEVYTHFFEFPDLYSGFYWYTHGVGMLVSLLCAIAGSFSGARSMLRLRPAEAMRPEPPQRGRAIWLERFQRLWSGLSAGWRNALRSVFRHRVRTAAGLFAAAMGAGLLVTGFMMLEAQNYLLDFQFYRAARSDIDLSFVDERGPDALAEIRSLPGVDYAEPVLNVACTFVHGPYRRKSGVTGLLADARLTVPRDKQGEPIQLPEHGLVISRTLAEILHVQPGDSLTLIPVKGERRPVEMTVTRISDSFMGLSAFAEIHYLSRVVDEEFVMSGVQLLTDGDAAHEAALHRELKRTPAVQAINSRRDMIENLTETLLQNQWVFIGVLVAFAGVIFFGSIVNASVVNLAERQREVATLGALGYSPWQIGGLFLRESLLVNMLGTIMGLPLGYALMALTAVSYNNELIRLPIVSAPWVWIDTVLLSIAFALMAHAVVQWSILRMNYLEALNVKE
jgi:putative ABC transport system permease protein